MTVLLDTSAVLAFLWREQGEDRVAETMESSAICSVNLAELGSKLIDRGGTPDEVHEVIDALNLPVLPLNGEAGLQAGLIRSETRAAGLSLGDRSCLACARALGAERVLTADRAWADLDLGVEIEVIR